jgi:hypothetical protein
MSDQNGLGRKFDPDTLQKIVAKSTKSKLPPSGFDPLAASQEELKELGFPMRPDPVLRRAAYEFWRTMFARPMQFEAFRFEVRPAEKRHRIFFGQLPRRQTSLNWSGAYIKPRDGTIFSEIWGRFQVPTPNLPSGGGPGDKYRCSTWIGFDGQRRYLSSTLPQIGTAQNIDPVGGASSQSYFAWWQWWVRDVVGAPVVLTSPAIHAGDLIMCFMQVADDRTEVSFAIANLTTGRVVQFSQNSPFDDAGQHIQVSGATAEWITERSAEPPDPTPLQLPDYGTVNFHDCGATAINMDTGAVVERSLSAATLIDMYTVKRNPDRIAKISIAKSLDTTEFLTHFR